MVIGVSIWNNLTWSILLYFRISSDDDDDDDEDDTEALLAELELIKKERAEEKLRKVRFNLLWSL